MTALEHAKQLLPLPALLAQLGLREHAKKTAKCPLHEDRNPSFGIYRNRSGEWAWKCHSQCGGGDEVDLIAKLESLDNSAACKRYMQIAGAQQSGDWQSSQSTTKPQETPATPQSITASFPMPSDVADSWREGVEYAQSHPQLAKHLARWRGWPEEFASYLIGCGAVARPKQNDERALAFQVVAPVGERGGMGTLPVGYHARLDTKAADKKATWLYVPNETSHQQRTPALPFILGDFERARLLVITEGQWDAATFALAAGWLGDSCIWPNGVGLIGIRGSSGTSPFLSHYQRYWPKRANCLLLADADAAGNGWYTGENSFATKLDPLCRKVAVVQCAPYKDFNELYKHERLGADTVYELLASHGMAVESEVLA